MRTATSPFGPPATEWSVMSDLGLVDVAGLDLVDDLAALDRAEVEQVGRVGGGVGERPGGGLEHDRGCGDG